MSLLAFDGFSRYRLIDEITNSSWVIETNDGNLILDTGGGQNERGAIQFGAAGLNTARVYWNLGTSQTELCLGFWFKWTGFDTTGGDVVDNIMSFQSTTSVRQNLRLRQNGSIYFVRSTNSTVFFDSEDTDTTFDGLQHYLFQGQENKIEMRGSWINATGSFEIRVNDEVWYRGTENVDLDGSINRIYFQTGNVGSGAKFSVSDWYLVDTDDGVGQTDFVGGSFQVEVLRPTGDSGTEADFTPSTGIDNYAMVDEAPQHDADSTYVSSTVNGDIDRYTTTTTLQGKRALGINVIAVARHEGTADNFRLTIFENATAGNGSTENLTDAFVPYQYFRTTNPDTSAEWIIADLEGSEFGVENMA